MEKTLVLESDQELIAYYEEETAPKPPMRNLAVPLLLIGAVGILILAERRG